MPSVKSLKARFALWVREGAGLHVLSLAGLVIVHALLLKPSLPHAIWHEFHAVELLAWAQGRSDGLAVLHGPGYGWLMQGLRRLTPDTLTVFDLNYAVSLFSAALLFGALRIASGSRIGAWAGAVLLLLLPVRLRLSVTESVFVWVEALSLTVFLFGALLVRDGRRRWLLGLLGACLMLAHTRAEMLALVPGALLLYAAAMAHRLPKGFWRSPWTWAGPAAAIALTLPRAAALAALGDPRAGGFFPRGGVWFLRERGLSGLNIVFDPAWTPAMFILLFLMGGGLLALRHRRLAAAVGLHIALATWLYAPHLSCLAVKARTGLATQYLCAALAAYGFGRAVQRLGRAGRAVASVALLIAAGWGAWARRGVLTEVFVKQREFAFLQEAGSRLPDGSLVSFLGSGDAPDAGWERDYQGDVLEDAARRAGRPVVALRAGAARGILYRTGPDGVYFFRGLACAGAPGARPHPVCAKMIAAGEPVMEERLALRAHGPESHGEGGAVLGLYRLAKLPAIPGGAPVPGPARLRLAEKARKAGAGRLAAAALAAAVEESEDPVVLRSAALLLQEGGEHSAALKLFDKLAAGNPKDASLRSDRGVLKAIMGDREGAEADLRRALELDPAHDQARRSLQALLPAAASDASPELDGRH